MANNKITPSPQRDERIIDKGGVPTRKFSSFLENLDSTTISELIDNQVAAAMGEMIQVLSYVTSLKDEIESLKNELSANTGHNDTSEYRALFSRPYALGDGKPNTGAFTAVTIDNIIIDGNDVSMGAGNLTLTPFAGSAVVIDGGASFDGTVLTGLTDLTSTNLTGTLQTAAQPNITSLGTLTTVTIDNITINGNNITSSSGNININPVAGSAVVIDGAASFDSGVLTGLTAATVTGKINVTQNSADFGIDIDQNGNATALKIVSASSNTYAFSMDMDGLTTGIGLSISTSYSGYTTGSLARLYSNSANTGEKELFVSWNDNTAAVGSANVGLRQDAIAPFIRFTGKTGGDASQAISTLATSGTPTHHIQCEVGGVKGWLVFSTNDPT